MNEMENKGQYSYMRIDGMNIKRYSLNDSVFFRIHKDVLSKLEILSIDPIRWKKLKESNSNEIKMMLDIHK